MKAVFRSKYGLPEVLSVIEIDKPEPGDDEILIKVFASTVNRTDCGILTGKPYIVRLFTGLLKPNKNISGTDFAGQIEAVGKNVQLYKVGEKVMGFTEIISCGSHAPFFVIKESVAKKHMLNIPEKLSYPEAAACLEGAFYASIGIKYVNPRAGQKALVYGATGAIGTSYVQFFKYYDVTVTAVCSGENIELVKSLGADKVIDYTITDFTKDEEKYDFVFDAVGKCTFQMCKPLMKEKGIFTSSDSFINIFWALITPLFGGKKVIFPYPSDIVGGLTFIKKLVEKSKFKPVIDRFYQIEEIADAFNYVLSGKKIGNVIISLDDKC